MVRRWNNGRGKKAEEAEDLETAHQPEHPSTLLAPHAKSASPPGTQMPLRRPPPTLFFADYPTCFTTSLETVAQRRWDGVSGSESDNITVGAGKNEAKRDQVAVWNTLLELYLDEGVERNQYTPCEYQKTF